ncbi:MAG: hypothetical protein NT029_00620 [Armatimonadetes bacterium]|nr:hypothetical protein [Armatimonadota bacterium]
MTPVMTTCAFCGHSFSEEEGATSCGACAAFGGCRKVKCPGCGYETPQTSPLVRWLMALKAGRKVA